ncbi:short-chain dehydrogenase/reductase [Chitinophaga caeni]|uniref:Short-chain dehydrogenase/reductase n=1 Tax=Chitinophaga caeni TaxID=2029983 RepID=A0A291QWL5_9BACT|nr:SDR family oxidoreductase [Chitinophaga caeni]ATL48327.1 short-chain dehydrogenase/reductase [Chitinophaga caeni]
MKQKVWFVTGASKGLGLALVKKLLTEGHSVAATSRDADVLAAAVGDPSKNFLSLQLDLRNEAAIGSALREAQQHFGRLDVIVNNAGYGIGGTLEELNSDEIEQAIDINLNAPIFVMKYAIPYLREQKSGHIINISSIAGFAGAMSWGIYNAAKAGLIAFSEAFAQEVKEFGIQVTVIAPGAFRTEFITSAYQVQAGKEMPEYKAVRETQTRYAQYHGKQTGDPAKAAKVMMDIANHPDAPVLLFLGSDAYKRALDKIESWTESIKQLETLSTATDIVD